MTTLIAWIAFTGTGERPELPRAVYMASDSRITWGSSAHRWDAGRKLFSPHQQPHLFGYCGDVVFPSLVLGQIISAIDQGILFDPSDSSDRKHQVIFESINASHDRWYNVREQDFSIVHMFRRGVWPATAFSGWVISYRAKTRDWTSEELQIPTKTTLLIALGSGAGMARVHTRTWNDSDVGGTSRAIFSAFCEAISATENKLSGGPPQLSGLYSDQPPKTFGIVLDGHPFLHGLPLKPEMALSNIEWRDQLFQTIDPRSMSAAEGARRFVRPHFD